MPCSVTVVSARSILASRSLMVPPASAILSWRACMTVSRRVMALFSLTRGPETAATSPIIEPRATTTIPIPSRSLMRASKGSLQRSYASPCIRY